MFVKVQSWLRRWESGAVAGTRDFLHLDGRVEGIPTKRAVYVSWHPKELQELIRILQAERPDWPLTADLAQFYRVQFPRSRLLPRGERLTTMVSYREDVHEILETLEAVRTGRASSKDLNKELETGSFWDAASK